MTIRPLPILALLALFALAGCGGGSSDVDASASLPEFAVASTASVKDAAPIGDAAVAALDAQSGGNDSELLLGDGITRGSGSGTVNATVNGLALAGTWAYTYDTSTKTLSTSCDVTAAGTVTGTGTADDGTVVNLRKQGAVTNDAGTLTISGTLAKGADGYTLQITRAFAKTDTTVSLHTTALIKKNGTTVYTKDITRSITRTLLPPRTVSGSLSVTDPTTGVTRGITYNTLVFKPLITGGLDYLGGTVALTWTKGPVTLTATLTPANGKLTGPITDGNGTVVGTMTIANGTVSVVKAE
jgi:hypothetical protein